MRRYRRKRVALQREDAALKEHHVFVGEETLGWDRRVGGHVGAAGEGRVSQRKAIFPKYGHVPMESAGVVKKSLTDTGLDFADGVAQLLCDSLTLVMVSTGYNSERVIVP